MIVHLLNRGATLLGSPGAPLLWERTGKGLRFALVTVPVLTWALVLVYALLQGPTGRLGAKFPAIAILAPIGYVLLIYTLIYTSYRMALLLGKHQGDQDFLADCPLSLDDGKAAFLLSVRNAIAAAYGVSPSRVLAQDTARSLRRFLLLGSPLLQEFIDPLCRETANPGRLRDVVMRAGGKGFPSGITIGELAHLLLTERDEALAHHP